MSDPLSLTDTHPLDENGADFRAHVGRISRQSSVYFAGTIFTVAAGYLFKIFVARVLGAEALGVYALGMTATGLLGVLAGGGLPQSATRYVAAYSATGQVEKLRGFLWRGAVILILLQLAAGALLMMAKNLVAYRIYHAPEIATYMGFFVALMLLGALTSFFSEVLAGYRDVSRRTVIVNFVGTPALMIAVAIFLIQGYGLRGYLLGQAVSAVAVTALLIFTTWKLNPVVAHAWPPRYAPLGTDVRRYAGTLLGLQILDFLLAQTDRIALGIFTGAANVGIYALAIGVTGFVPIILKSVNQIFSPTIAELHAKQQSEVLRSLYQSLTKWTLGLTIPLAFSVMVFARPLMEVFGRDFAVGWPVLIIATVGELINCGVGSVGMLLLMSGQESAALRFQFVLAPIVTILNFAVIPFWGLIGATTVAALTNAAMNFLYLRAVRNTLGIVPSARGYMQLLPASFLTLGVILGLRFLTQSMHQQLWILLATLIASYIVFVGVFAAQAKSEEDTFILRTALAKIRGTLGI